MTEADKALRTRFWRSEEALMQKNCQQAAIFGAVFMLVGTSLDLVVYPEMVKQFFINRSITAMALTFFAFAIHYIKELHLMRVVVHTVALLPIVSIALMIFQTEGADSPYHGGLNLVLVGATLMLRWRTIDSIINAVLCLVIYIAECRVFGNSWSSSFVPAYFIFVTGAIACTGTYFYNQGRFREFRLSQEVKQARDQLEDSNQQLRAMDETKSRFFANLSHELRTPLTLILGPTENLRSSKVVNSSPALIEHLDTIEENGYRLLRLINDILDLVKLDSGESPPRPETVNVESFIEGLVSNLKPIAALKEIHIVSKCDLPGEGTVWLDRDRMEKIMLNLAMNAVKFTDPEGKIELRAKIEDEKLSMSVSDSGRGMSEEDVANVFVRFWQADMSAKRRHRGAGIGLSLVKSLSESMDGGVSVQSKLGEGTTFVVTLPATLPPNNEQPSEIADSEHDVLERFNDRARMTYELDKTAFTGHLPQPEADNEDVPARETNDDYAVVGKTILVADDEAAMRKFIIRQLSEHRVIEARDGNEAWQLCQETSPDLIILDLMMPGMDGIEVARKIRDDHSLSRVPIVLITAQASEAPRLEALDAGVNDFISKPFSTVELQTRSRNLLKSSAFEVELAENNISLENAYEQLKGQETLLVQSEKLSSLGRMSAGIVHEVNNPLNYTKTALHALQTFKSSLEEEEREDFLDVLGDAQEGVQRVIGIVSDLRSFTRGDTASMQPQPLHRIIESARRLSSSSLSEIEFEVNVDESINVQVNEGQICQLLINLLQNSARAIKTKNASDERGHISVNAEVLENGEVKLDVTDNGCGIKKEDLEQIFDPFFTKNDVGEGMGLGLSICHSIIQQHDARVSVDSVEGEFTRITIHFRIIEKQ